ncbi:MAG: tRNA (N(6)-L-threonylcarbamoyladenosine(37)-C(2))-methylthiotransferase MtaB, partial [Lachnoclostridium sp.]|nr:tRNA (N(6)-L-threonylcarbamoyladenosine(37)-C(2))-methylthiotransferase MtaB [Lachnoclostridium sp.]
MKKAALHNLGCKVNAYETEAMQQMLEENGYEIVPFKEGADVYIINTCTVTNMADRKSRQMIHRARKMNPDAVIVAAGCYVQAQGEQVDECIDIVIGNNRKKDLIEILDAFWEKKSVRETVIDINHTSEYEEL